jgi:hypothetical protein
VKEHNQAIDGGIRVNTKLPSGHLVRLSDLLALGMSEDDLRRNHEIIRDAAGHEWVEDAPVHLAADAQRLWNDFRREIGDWWLIESTGGRQERRDAYMRRAVSGVATDRLHGSEVAIRQAEAAQNAAAEFDKRFPLPGSAPNADRDEVAAHRRLFPERWKRYEADRDAIFRGRT